MIKKFAAIGNSMDTLLCFKAIGADIFAFETASDIILALKNLGDEYAVAFITQETAEIMLDELAALRASLSVAIVIVPTTLSSDAFSVDLLKRDIEQAIGTDAIFNK